MFALLARWAPAIGLVCSLAVLTSACSTPAPMPEDELALRLTENNLVLTPDGDGPFPAVLLLHTCFGNLGHVDEWARRLQAHGYVAVVVNSMQARGLAGHIDNLSVCAGRTMPASDRARDIVLGIEGLRRSAFVDPERIGVIGFSHGGWTLLDFLGGPPAIHASATATDARDGLRSVVAVYPYCGADVQAGLGKWPADVQVLVLLAESDGTVGTAKCEKLVQAQTARGYALSMHMYPGAKHGYDIDPALLGGYDERYDEAAALDTRERIVGFLARTLKTGSRDASLSMSAMPPHSTLEIRAHVQNSHRRLW